MDWHAFLKSPAGGIVCFWLGWFATGGLAAWISGWPRLARRFAARPAVGAGERFRFASGFVGKLGGIPISFRFCLGLIIDQQGIHFSVLLPWRFMQPPFFLPWTEVESLTRLRFMFAEHSVLLLQDSRTCIRVSGRAGLMLLEAWAQSRSSTQPVGAAEEAAPTVLSQPEVI